MPTRTRMLGFLEFSFEDETKKLRPPALHCPHGHRIPWEYAFHEAGYPRCRHRSKGAAEDCNARLFVQFFPRVAKNAPPLMFVAAVEYEELVHILDERMDTYEILTYLGVSWAPAPVV